MFSCLRTIAALSALALLAACGRSDDAGNGTSITIRGKTDMGETASASAGPEGKVAINVPGFNMELKLPKIALDADNIDIGGVKLYPGSKVTSVNIAGDGYTGKNEGKIQIVFDAPADLPVVHGWFVDRMKAEKFTVSAGPDRLSGTTDEDDPFTLEFTAGAKGHTTGTFIITD